MTRFPQLPTLPTLKLPATRLPGLAAPPVPRGRADNEILTPEEEFSLLRGAMGGVQYIGESLDKPGAALRGFLATGDPEQLLHAIPFSEAIGLAPKKKVSGRELLHRMGLASKNRPGFRGDVGGDIAGFAAEVALDPLWLVAGLPLVKGAASAASKGAKGAKSLSEARKGLQAAAAAVEASKAGRPMEVAQAAAKGLGRTPPAIMAEQIRAGQRAIAGLKLPFARRPIVTFGAGSKVGAWAVEKAFYGGGMANPLVWMRGMFSHTAGAKGTKEFFGGAGKLQRAKDIAFAERQLLEDAVSDAMPSLSAKGDELAEQFAQIAAHHGGKGDREAFEAFTRASMEAQKHLKVRGEELPGLIAEHAKLPLTASVDDVVDSAGRMADEFYRYTDTIMEMQNDAYRRVETLGGHTPVLDDIYIAHTARRAAAAARLVKRKGGRKEIREAFEPWLARKELYRGVPGGTATLNAVARNPLITGTAHMSKKEIKEQVIPALRERLDDLGIAWGDKESLLALQEKFTWAELFKRPMQEGWEKMPVNEVGEMLDEAGEIMTYARGPLQGHPVTLKNEITSWTQPLYKPTVMPEGPSMLKGPAKAVELQSRLRRFIRRFNRLPPEVRERGLFSRAPLEDALDYTKSILEWESVLRGAHHFLGQKGIVGLASQGATGVPLRDVWKGIKLGKKRALTEEGLQTFVRKQFPEAIGTGSPDEIAAVLDDLRIVSGADTVLETTLQTLSPRVQGDVGRLIDRVNAMFKGWLFVPWPAAHSRNLLSGYYQSWSDGHVNSFELLDGYLKAHRHVTKGEPLASLDLLKREGLLGQATQLAELTTPEALAGVSGVPAGGFGWAVQPLTPRAIKAKGLKQALDPFATRGVHEVTPEMRALGIQPALNAPMEAGERAYQLVEFLNRAGYAEALLKKGYGPSEIRHLVKRSQFDYSELSKFEQTVLKRGVLFYCVDDKTEALTKEGWKTHDRLKENEIILTRNMKTDCLEWQPITTMFRYDYKGHLLKFGGRTFSKVCTIDHNFVTTKGLKRAINIGWNDRIPLNGRFEQADCNIPDDLLRIITWIVTDGSTRMVSANGNDYCIYQKKEPYLSQIRELLGDSALETVHPETDVTRFVIRHPLKARIREFYNSKSDFLSLVLQLSARQLEIVREIMLDAEGTRTTNKAGKYHEEFKQKDGSVLDAFQIACLLTQRNSRISEYEEKGCRGIYVSKKPRAKCQAPEIVWYEGVVWCPQTDNRTWIMRREGKIIPTGNSWPRNNVPFTLSKLIERPGGRTAQTFRAFKLARGEETREGAEEYTPSFLGETLGLRWGGTPQAAHFIRQSGIPIEEFNKLVVGSPRRTAEKLAAYLHPLVLAGPELAADRQFYTGRPISQLQPVTGVRGLDTALHYTPASRFVSEAASLADRRKNVWQKGLNALSGLKTATYDIEFWRMRDLEQALRRELAEDPLVGEGMHYFVPQKQRGTPEAAAAQQRIRQRRAISKAIQKLREAQKER